MNWANYFFHTDFSDAREILESLPLGRLSDNNLNQVLSVLSQHDEGEHRADWNGDENGGHFSLNAAEVVYNGANSQSLPTKSLMGHVVTIELRAQDDLPVRRLYLQFN